ncbi:MAG: beta-galactosidase [Bacteroidaceae bacterium]|nr:beta-galactosidase [Bacteroidaceae bacterium]
MWMGLSTLSASEEQEQHIPSIKWDKHSLIIDGKRKAAVMGEVHYSRIPENEWKDEVRKMKEGGITIIATYVFWNHIEEQEGIFDWSGQRNLRRFIEICGEENLPVIVRIGPFCHGEVRNGGIPDWMFSKGCKMRQTNATFMHYVDALYRQIYSQIVGLQWKDGGPIIACQFDNEYRGSGDYLMALKKKALEIGFDLPFYTRTGWPELSKPVPFGEMIPLYGDYADGFWERSIKETAGNYWKAFHFKAFRSSTAIASEQLGEQKEKLTKGDELYPYFTCELGGGMMTAYHRRVYLYPEDAYSMAVVKLGSGSNLLGYYMYHGGTNPEGKLTTLNEEQRTIATNYNDLPVKTYDFQAPLGEFGQRNPHYYTLRTLHMFMADFGEELAPMEAYFPVADKPVAKGEDSYLRWSYRTKDGSGFVFINNYERLQNLTDKKGVQFSVGETTFPKRAITIPAGTMAVLPVGLKVGNNNIEYATVQPVARRIENGVTNLYMMQLDGIRTEISINGKVKKGLKAYGTVKPTIKEKGLNIYLLTPEQASVLFLPEEATRTPKTLAECSYNKTRTAGAPRTITIGVNKVAESPVDKDFEQAACYKITLPEGVDRTNALLDIDYLGDVARLYANGKLIDDNFWNSRHFQYALWRLPADCHELELRILPLQKDMPVYFPSAFKSELEQGIKVGEQINKITIIERK